MLEENFHRINCLANGEFAPEPICVFKKHFQTPWFWNGEGGKNPLLRFLQKNNIIIVISFYAAQTFRQQINTKTLAIIFAVEIHLFFVRLNLYSVSARRAENCPPRKMHIKTWHFERSSEILGSAELLLRIKPLTKTWQLFQIKPFQIFSRNIHQKLLILFEQFWQWMRTSKHE